MLMVAMEVQAVVTVVNLYNRRISWELVAENGSLEVANYSNALAKVTKIQSYVLKVNILVLESFV